MKQVINYLQPCNYPPEKFLRLWELLSIYPTGYSFATVWNTVIQSYIGYRRQRPIWFISQVELQCSFFRLFTYCTVIIFLQFYFAWWSCIQLRTKHRYLSLRFLKMTQSVFGRCNLLINLLQPTSIRSSLFCKKSFFPFYYLKVYVKMLVISHFKKCQLWISLFEYLRVRLSHMT